MEEFEILRGLIEQTRMDVLSVRAEMREEIRALRGEIAELRRQVSGNGLSGRLSAVETRVGIMIWVLMTAAGGVILYIINAIMKIL